MTAIRTRTHLTIRSLLIGALTALTLIAAPDMQAQEDGFKPIFNGTDLTGWSAPEMSYWSVEDGAITGTSTPDNPATENQFIVWQQGTVDDFELKLKFKLTGSDQANSGIQFRGQIQPDGHVIGYQADIDRAGQWVGALYDEHGRALLASRGQSARIDDDGTINRATIADSAELFSHVNVNGWNDYHIIATGNHITLRVNGHTTVQIVDNDTDDRDFFGLLALQLHSGPPQTIQFKDIMLKRLPLSDGRKKAVFVAGRRSHGYFSHEHNAGSLLLAESISNSNIADRIHAVTYTDSGYPNDPTAFDNADTIVVYCDGGGGHLLNDHLDNVEHLMQRGVGLVCVHYGVETLKGREGDKFLDFLGGYFEPNWSVNPHWDASFTNLPIHPITNGVNPFTLRDEWYYHMRFRDGMQGVTPILTAMPGPDTLTRPDGPHSGNPHVRAAINERKEPQHVAWAYQRPDGARGFGFTGGHFHRNWAHNDFRKIVLNAVAWTAHLDVPTEGVTSPDITAEQLEANQDYEQPGNWSTRELQSLINSW